MEFDNSSTNEAVYIGSDIGVYYRDNAASDWTYYNTNLPRVIVHELEIHYATGMIRAATHGRGMWESPLALFTGRVPEPKPVSTLAIYPSVTKGPVTVDLYAPRAAQAEISLIDGLGRVLLTQKEWISGTDRVALDLSDQQAGIYFVRVKMGEEVRTCRVMVAK